MGTLKVERVGGLAGYGAPGSALQATGEVAVAELSDDDQATVAKLFKAKGRVKASGPPIADGFSYRMTRTASGKSQTIEVPEDAVPAAVLATVKEEFR